MKKLTIILAMLSMSLDTHAENLIRGFLNKLKTTSDTHPGLKRSYVGDSGLFFYKLPGNQQAAPNRVEVSTEQGTKYDPQAIAAAIKWQQSQSKDVINKHEQTKETGHAADVNERDTLYGKDSPLQNDEVIQAWREADEAQKRLEEHRAYMERVRKARKKVEHSKTADTSISN